MSDRRFFVGQKAIIERDGRILVLLYDTDHVDLPGGRIEPGESDLAASLQREVREETGLEIAVGPVVSTWINHSGEIFLPVYRCRSLSGDVRLSDEHDSFRWVGPDDYRQLDDGSTMYAAIDEYFRQESCLSGEEGKRGKGIARPRVGSAEACCPSW